MDDMGKEPPDVGVRPTCPNCDSDDWEWLPEKGEGEGGYCVYRCKHCGHEEVW